MSSESESESGSRASSASSTNPEMKSKYACIGNVANWGKVEPVHLFDKKDAFISDVVQAHFVHASPKADAMLKKIAEVDAKDIEEFGHTYKHMIFAGNPNVSYGSKIVASILMANGFQLAFHASDNGQLAHKPIETLQELSASGTNVFTMLASKPLYGKPMTTYFKQRTLKLFNLRAAADRASNPEARNNHGELMRFIIVDSGFREGIDLFDIKYIHLFEPTPIKADEKQAIGRGTRFCGQKGIYFNPKSGWPLHVFRYEVNVAPELQDVLQADKFMDLQLRFSELDPRLINFAASLDDVVIEGAVDRLLNKDIHEFKVTGGADTDCPAGGAGRRVVSAPPRGPGMGTGTGMGMELALLSARSAPEPHASVSSSGPRAPTRIMNHDRMQAFIREHFYDCCKYPTPVLENKCGPLAGGAKQIIADFTPTQDFMRYFFRPESAYKGILAYHSVGSGKTCTGIAVASDSFEKQGYTILWVTRHTLKADVAKNQFGIVCNVGLQQRLRQGRVAKQADLSRGWMKPISYKQFSNMLLQKNSIYSDMVSRNGVEDPLRKTLIIIDEAHKLYAPDSPAAEKPNMSIMEEMLQKSYSASGKDSARLLLMTGTPYTKSPMEMIKLMNLMRPSEDALPSHYDDFARAYLDGQGAFTAVGRKKFLDEIAGYISYLNRSSDARNFAYPVIKNVFVDMSMTPVHQKGDKFNRYTQGMKELRADIRMSKKQDKNGIAECVAAAKQWFTVRQEETKAAKAAAMAEKKRRTEGCKTAANKVECRENVKFEYDRTLEEIARALEAAKADHAREKLQCKEGSPETAAKIKALEDMKAEYETLKQQRINLKIESATHKLDASNMKTAYKQMQQDKNMEYAEISKIKDDVERRNRRKEHAVKFAQLKQMIKEINIIRQKMQKIKVRVSLISEKIGTKYPPDLSQETGLRKKCHFDDLPERNKRARSPPRPSPGTRPNAANQPPPPPPPPPHPQPPRRQSPPYSGPSVADFNRILQANGAAGAKKAYLKLTLQYHPDKHPNSQPKNEAIFKVLQKAWDQTKQLYRMTGGEYVLE